MNQKDKDSLSELLKETSSVYQNISRQIHWTAVDSAGLDNIEDSKELQKDIQNRLLKLTGSREPLSIVPLFLAYKAWQRTKAVYSFNREFVNTMSLTEDTHLATSLLERLPFKDMLFFFPEGAFPYHKNEETAGIYVHIEQHPEHLWVFFNSVKRDLGNDGKMFPGFSIAFPYKNGMKISQIFETPQYLEWLSSFRLKALLLNQMSEQEIDEHFLAEKMKLNTAVNLMYYLSSKNADVKEIKKQKKKPKSSPNINEIDFNLIKNHEVGTQYAETILYRRLSEVTNDTEKAEETVEDPTTTQAAKPSKKRRPHARRAHWQHYWTGKGRTILEVRWISDLFVGTNHNNQAIVVYDTEKTSIKGKKNPNTSKKKKHR